MLTYDEPIFSIYWLFEIASTILGIVFVFVQLCCFSIIKKYFRFRISVIFAAHYLSARFDENTNAKLVAHLATKEFVKDKINPNDYANVIWFADLLCFCICYFNHLVWVTSLAMDHSYLQYQLSIPQERGEKHNVNSPELRIKQQKSKIYQCVYSMENSVWHICCRWHGEML